MRWRLMQPHYLNVPVYPDGTKVEWEHKETDRTTGRVNRKYHTVPCLLDTNNPGDYNDGDGIVVCHEGGGNPKDYVFLGDPTPDMEPLDDEAEALSASMRPKWEHPINSLPANGGMNEAESAFMQNMMKAFAQQVGAANTAVPNKDVEDLKAIIAKQQEQIDQLLSGKAERRV